MISFSDIYARAAQRKGGEDILQSLLPEPPDNAALAAMADDRLLAEMTKCIFRAGFVWRVIEQKWPGFEDAFLGFSPQRLVFETDEFWEGLAGDKRIVRNPQKIAAVRHNARFVTDLSAEHGGLGKFIASWPEDNITGLWAYFAKAGKRLGGMTGRYFTRAAGKDCWLPSHDVTAALRDAGLDIAENPTSKRDLGRIETRINQWRAETGHSLMQISRILAMSVGENYDPEHMPGSGRHH